MIHFFTQVYVAIAVILGVVLTVVIIAVLMVRRYHKRLTSDQADFGMALSSNGSRRPLVKTSNGGFVLSRNRSVIARETMPLNAENIIENPNYFQKNKPGSKVSGNYAWNYVTFRTIR